MEVIFMDLCELLLEVIENEELGIRDERTIPFLQLLVNNGDAISVLEDELKNE